MYRAPPEGGEQQQEQHALAGRGVGEQALEPASFIAIGFASLLPGRGERALAGPHVEAGPPDVGRARQRRPSG